MADRLTEVLCDKSLKDGFVLGIEGPWGSGKSSLLKKTIKKLSTLEEPPAIVEFNPWLVGDKLELIREYFIALSEALESQPDAAIGKSEQAKKQVKEGLQKYSKHINTGANLLSIGALLIPQLEVGSKLARKLTESFEDLSEPEPLHKQKEVLEQALRKICRPIIVFVDDTERLDPPEVMETLRLLRSVGDLPNIIYVVAYDRSAMVRNIGLALKAEDLEATGAAYLEKIVQATLQIPYPEDFALRRWLKAEVLELCQPNEDSSLQGDAIERLNLVIDKEGGRMISTPRDVIRLMNNIKIAWPAIGGFVDVADLIWIHLLKLKRPKLYHWTENYLNGFAEVARGTARASDPEAHYKELLEVAAKDYNPESIDFFHLSRILPGLKKQNYGPGDCEWTTYSIDEEELENLTRFRRLGSPHYYRYYFALGQNQGFIPAQEIKAALQEIQAKSKELKDRLLTAAKERFADGELHYPVLLDSLRPHMPTIDADSRKFFLRCMIDSVDQAIKNSNLRHTTSNRSVSAAKSILYYTTKQGSQMNRELKKIISSEASLSFAADLVRDLVNDTHYSIRFSAEQTTKLKGAFADRLSKDPRQLVLAACPNVVLSMWNACATDREDFQAKLTELFSDTQNLITVIGADDARRTVYSTEGNWRPLVSSYYEDLTGEPGLKKRIESIAMNKDQYPPNLQPAIQNIIDGLKDQKEYEKHWN
ncbi:hypothetical protein HY3_00420 [Hyphomonas pacifica]|uniref:Uncharacterized protein n=1 Tax=Hyphomonas pacifica TaxID=1280941 RepID=A0A062U451_9PROT|nr:hypothetical protein HY2_00650 [Hyphomonas pacifica]RAN36074.1 hypothetical protein HY3_00420 [Hyphomonas pacifica]